MKFTPQSRQSKLNDTRIKLAHKGADAGDADDEPGIVRQACNPLFPLVFGHAGTVPNKEPRRRWPDAVSLGFQGSKERCTIWMDIGHVGEPSCSPWMEGEDGRQRIGGQDGRRCGFGGRAHHTSKTGGVESREIQNRCPRVRSIISESITITRMVIEETKETITRQQIQAEALRIVDEVAQHCGDCAEVIVHSK